VEQHAVDERVGEDRQVVARSRRIDVREPGTPAHALARHVHRVDDDVLAGRVRERAMQQAPQTTQQRSRASLGSVDTGFA
jgi:hypothetical protein